MERKRHLKIGISSYTDTHTVLGVTGNAEFSGIVTALEFHGDGSNLTNITADAGAYAGTSGFATVAGYAHTAGIATNATTAGSATTATAAATAYSLTGRPDIEINNLDVAGISTLTGNVSFGSSAFFGDSDIINMGDSNDLQIFHSGVTGNIKNTTGTLILQSGTVRIQDAGSSETAFSAADGVAQLYYKNSTKLETTGYGISVYGGGLFTGISTFQNDVHFGDGDKINLGDNDDFQIFHHSNGTGIIQNAGSGQLQIRSDEIRLLNQATDEDYAFFRDDGAVELYYDNVKRFETTQSGIIVTGIATADGFVGPLTGDVTGDLTGDVNAGVITAVTGNFTGNVTIGGTLTYEDVTNVDSIGLITARDGIKVNTNGIHVLSGITTLQDLDAQDLNIRNITGAAATFTDSVSLYDNDKIFLGTSQEMEIFHGTLGNSFFTSTKPLYIKYGQSGQTHEMFIQNDTTTAAKFTDDASVELYYNGGKKLETVGGGVTVTGDLRVSGVVTATRFESTSSGTPSIDSPNNLDLNASNVAVSTDMSVGRNLTVVGFVSAANFYGDGSGLTNLPSQSYVANAGVATYAQTAGIATLAENLTGSPAITISSATVGSDMTIQSSNIYRSNADLTLTGGGPQSTRSQLVLSNGSSATLKANDDSGSVVLKAPVGSVQVLDVGVTTSTPFLRTGAAGTVRLDRGDGNFTGVVTATTFYGDFQGTGSGITGITATYANTAGVSTVSQGLTGTPDIEVANLNVSGVATFQSSVNLGSNDRLNFNTTNTTIYGDSNGLNIEAAGNNDVLIKSNASGSNAGDVKLRTVEGGRIDLTGTGGVGIYHTDTALKLQTTGVGATVFGTTETQQLSVSGVSTFLDGGNGEIKVFESSGDPIVQKSGGGLFHFRTNNGFDIEDNSGNLFARYGSGGGGVGDGVSLYHNAIERVATTNAGVVVTGILTATSFSGALGSQLDTNGNNIKFADNDEAIFGNNSDLRIDHDGTDNHITSYDKDLNIELNPDVSTPKIYIRPNTSHQGITLGGGSGNPVELYHNNSKKFETTGSGVVVTGIVTATSYRGDGSQLTGVLAASEAGISIQDDQSAVGVSTTIDFGSGLSVSPVSAGVVTVTSGASAGISPVIAGMIF